MKVGLRTSDARASHWNLALFAGVFVIRQLFALLSFLSRQGVIRCGYALRYCMYATAGAIRPACLFGSFLSTGGKCQNFHTALGGTCLLRKPSKVY